LVSREETKVSAKFLLLSCLCLCWFALWFYRSIRSPLSVSACSLCPGFAKAINNKSSTTPKAHQKHHSPLFLLVVAAQPLLLPLSSLFLPPVPRLLLSSTLLLFKRSSFTLVLRIQVRPPT
jgi:hypothetical protein